MRTALVLLVAVFGSLALSGCGDDGGGGSASIPVGAWTLDREKTIESGIASVKRSGAPAGVTDAQIRQGVEKNVAGGSLRMEFKADKTLTLDTKGLAEDATGGGTWTKDGDKVLITLTTKNGKPTEGTDKEPATLAIRGDRLVMLAPDGEETFWLKRP